MTGKYENLSATEIRAMIRGLLDELDHREIRQFEAVTRAYQAALKESGYTDEDVGSPDKIRQLMMKVNNNNIKLADYATRQTRKVRPKYRHPKTNNEWAGRGAFAPPWVLKVMEEKGWTLEEFKKSDEFRVKADKKQK